MGVIFMFAVAFWLGIVAISIVYLFILFEAFPIMCHPSCDDPQSLRVIWLEIISQTINGMFCIIAFGGSPLAIREFYYLLRWRCFKNGQKYHRLLAGFHRGWYRLPGSDTIAEYVAPPGMYKKKDVLSDEDAVDYTLKEIEELEANEALPLPVFAIPDPPLTGIRATPTRTWYLDIVICISLGGIFIQGGLALFMWAFDKYSRPFWIIGWLIGIGTISNIVLGVILFKETNRIIRIEGS